MDTTFVFLLTAVAVFALFLAGIAIRAAKRNADRVDALDYSLKHAQEHGRERWSRVNDRVDGIEKGLIAGGAELGAIGKALRDISQQHYDRNQKDGRMGHQMYSLASHLGLYWDEAGRWSEHGNGAIGGGLVGAQCASSGVAGAGLIRKATGRNSTKRRT